MAPSLLALHLVTLGLFARYKWCKYEGGLWRAVSGVTSGVSLTSEHIVYTMLVCNFIGVVFARSLHFQFYCWYWHALPFLLWKATCLPVPVKVGVLLALEYAWGYSMDAEGTSTAFSSAVLQVAHVVILAGLWFSEPEAPFAECAGKKTK